MTVHDWFLVPFIFRPTGISKTKCPTLNPCARMASVPRSPNPCQSCWKTRHIFDPWIRDGFWLCSVFVVQSAANWNVNWWKGKSSKQNNPCWVFQPLVFREVYIETEINGIFWHDKIFHWFSMDVMGLAATRRESEGDFPIKDDWWKAVI